MSEKPKPPTAQYEHVSLANVMQFFADNYKGDKVMKRFDGSTQAEWWIDAQRGEVVFRVWMKP